MSGLMGDLVNNTQALQRHSAGLQVAGRNLSNVNNPDYARQRLAESQNAGPGSQTFTTSHVEHIRDNILDRNLVREMFSTGSLEAQQSILQSLNQALGENLDGGLGSNLDSAGSATSLGGSLSGAMDGFYLAWEQLAASPNDITARQNVLQEADNLVDRMNTIHSDIDDAQSDLQTAMENDISEANDLISQIFELNKQIAQVESRSLDMAANLRDQRQGALEKLGKIMDFETRSGSVNGTIDIFTTDLAGNEVGLVMGENDPATLSLDTATNPYSVTVGTNALNLQGGRLQGYATVQANELTNLRAQMDALTSQIVTATNTAYNPDGLGNDFFTPTGLTAASMARNTVVDTGNLRTATNGDGGANDIALNIADLAGQTFATPADTINGTMRDFVLTSATTLGSRLANTEQKLENQTLSENLIREQRNSVSGVDLNEEVVNMLRSQRAFQASARVITTIDQMLATIVTGLGAR